MIAPRQCLLIAICLFAGSVAAAAAPSPLIANIPGRTSISLDRTWRAIVDPYETGTGMRFYENAKPIRLLPVSVSGRMVRNITRPLPSSENSVPFFSKVSRIPPIERPGGASPNAQFTCSTAVFTAPQRAC
jgi:hypothetical protein